MKKKLQELRIDLSPKDIKILEDLNGLYSILKSNNLDSRKILDHLQYESDLKDLQIELVKMQRWCIEKNERIVIIFEGRDAAGKGGCIKRFTQYLSPRGMRVVALPKPTDVERGQWYFQRYIKNLPNPGEIVFFDRSWYNRAVVEPVNGFCSEEEYRRFMFQVTAFENLLHQDNCILIKFWFDISKQEQKKRFESRITNPLKQWKQSPVDAKAQELWDEYTYYKNEMLSKTHTPFSPWIIVKGDDKKKARLEAIRYVLSEIPYPKKKKTRNLLHPDPSVVMRYIVNLE